MFCKECGAKLNKDDVFCGECGHKVKIPRKTNNKNKVKNSNLMSKKNKLLIFFIVCFLLIIIGGYIIVSNMFSPKTIGLKYFRAIVNNDVNILYTYMDQNNSKLTTKTVYKKLLQINNGNIKVSNYKVTSISKSEDGLLAIVNIAYINSEDNSSETMQIRLTKNKKNKFLIFDNWVVDADSTDIINEYKVRIPKDAKFIVADVEMTDKDLEKSDDEYDVYNMPSMFALTYPVTIELKNGLKFETKVNPRSNRTELLSLSLDNLSDDMNKTLSKEIRNNLEIIYEGAIAGKSYDDIKDKFDDNEELKRDYENFNISLNKRSRKLKKINFTEVELTSIDLDDNFNIELSYRVNYKYSATYEVAGTEKETTNSSYMSGRMTLKYENNEFKLNDVNSLFYYFY